MSRYSRQSAKDKMEEYLIGATRYAMYENPERALWLTVLLQAWRDMFYPRVKCRPYYRVSAQKFFHKENREHLILVCDCANVDIDWFMEKYQQAVAAGNNIVDNDVS